MLTELQIKQLEIVKILDDICTKHNIKYYANGGTLIGCYRHNGFIPHDVDMDFMMTRENFDKFLKVVDNELKHPFIFTSPYKNGFNYGFVNRIINVDTTYFTNDKHKRLSQYLGIPAGIFIDIFIFDEIPMDCKKLFQFTGKLNALKNEVISIQYECLKNYSDELVEKYRIAMNKYIDHCTMHKGKNCKLVTDVSCRKYKPKATWLKSWIDDSSDLRVKFENITLPVPKDGKKCLDVLYPNWDKEVVDTHPNKPFVDTENSYIKYNTGELQYIPQRERKSNTES